MTDLPRGHTYHPVTVSANARAHFGDVFIQVGSRKRPRDDDDEAGFSERQLPHIHDHDPAALLIKSLTFDGIWERHENIATEYPGTCSWSLASGDGQEAQTHEEDRRDQSLQNDFTNWLTSDQDFYRICGTAGAGKSTLLSFMVNHQDLVQQRLAQLRGDRQWVVTCFFFWKYGSFLQKSICGMLRSLIIQIISQIPSLVSKLQQSPLLKGKLNTALSLDQPWTRKKLETLLKATIDASSANICFLIDALDEFHGYYGESGLSPHELALRETTRDLLATIQGIKSLPAVKVCVASRPGNVFDHAFSDQPHLDLQRINMNDTEKYVHGELGQIFSVSIANYFAREVTRRSRGIFLWAKLVVGTMIEGFEDGEDVAEIFEKLNELPPGLEDTYRFMLSRIEPRFKDDSHVLFNLVTWMEQVFSDTDFQNALLILFSRACHLVPPSESSDKLQALNSNLSWLKKYIQSRGCGLLEVRTPVYGRSEHRNGAESIETELELYRLTESRITFIHRTAQEFVENHPLFSRRNLEQKVRHIVDRMLLTTSVDQEFMTYAAGLEQSVIQGGLMCLRAAQSCYQTSRDHSTMDRKQLVKWGEETYEVTLRNVLKPAIDRFGPRLFTAVDAYASMTSFQRIKSSHRHKFLHQPGFSRIAAPHIHNCGRYGLIEYFNNRIRQPGWIDDRDIPFLLELYMLPSSDAYRKSVIHLLNPLIERLARITEHTQLVVPTTERFLELIWTFQTNFERDTLRDRSLITMIRGICDQYPQIMNLPINVQAARGFSSTSWTTMRTSPAVILHIWSDMILLDMRLSDWIANWPVVLRIEALNLEYPNLEIHLDEELSAFVLEDMVTSELPHLELGTRQQCLRRDWIILYAIVQRTGILSQDTTRQSFLDRLSFPLNYAKHWDISLCYEMGNFDDYEAIPRFLECSSFGLRPEHLRCDEHSRWPGLTQMCKNKLRDCHNRLEPILNKDEWTRIDKFDDFMRRNCEWVTTECGDDE